MVDDVEVLVSGDVKHVVPQWQMETGVCEAVSPDVPVRLDAVLVVQYRRGESKAATLASRLVKEVQDFG